ncbi:MAG: NAD-dependent epimerase/dehydratase family protein [Rhodospirillales bacterium]|nr:NAD-dependent epimerase/dehydratase family protein [Rhodospirillales bacterium]MDE2574616.1 NAD-dependent epimerase/dehydratase family protein [Rhodospirillales bacterium]
MGFYLVTGGAGFIGSHLVDALLAAGHRVRVIDDLSTGKRSNLDPRAELVIGDVADAALVSRAMAGAMGCFHLAAIASVARGNEDWVGTHTTNLGGSIAVLDAARAHGRLPVVYASSAAVYGDQGETRLHEGLTPAPLSAYGADKLGSELHARVAFHVHGVPTLGLRFFNVFGPRQDPHSPYSGVISIFTARIRARRSLTVFGDGKQSRDFVHVGDVVAHLLAGMQRLHARPEPLVLNVCSGRAVTILDLADLLAGLLRWTPAVVFANPREGDIRSSLGSPSAARLALRMAPARPLADGLGHYLAADLPAPRRAAM